MPAEVIELVAEARREFRYGASRTRLWLMRDAEHRLPAIPPAPRYSEVFEAGLSAKPR